MRIIYDAAYEDLSIDGTMSVQSEIIDKVWEAEDIPGWPHIHFIPSPTSTSATRPRCRGAAGWPLWMSPCR